MPKNTECPIYFVDPGFSLIQVIASNSMLRTFARSTKRCLLRQSGGLMLHERVNGAYQRPVGAVGKVSGSMQTGDVPVYSLSIKGSSK